jgi:hypothetical protein
MGLKRLRTFRHGKNIIYQGSLLLSHDEMTDCGLLNNQYQLFLTLDALSGGNFIS